MRLSVRDHPTPAHAARGAGASPASFGERPIYWTDIVVAVSASFARLEDVFGGRFAWTTEDSQSGWQAPRQLLAPHARRHDGRLFAATVGPLVTPREVALAVAEGRADAGPLDSYAHALLRKHEPALAAQFRVIAQTPATPIPPLVGAPALPSGAARRLRAALADVGSAPALAAAREALLLDGFARLPAATYDVLAAEARRADEQGYLRIA